MKNVLLGTTALVAAGLVASNAQAATGVQLGLGGYYAAAAGILFSQDNNSGEPGSHTRNIVFRQDVEVHFKGETTLDNGLTVGAEIQLEAQTSSDQIDEVWAYFKGGWGQIRFGDDDDASSQLTYLIPSASNIFGVDSPYFEFQNGHTYGGGTASATNTNSTNLDISSDATKIIYFSPSFGGFTFAASFAPDRRGEDTHSGVSYPGGTTMSNNAGQVQNVFSAAVNFDHDFNGFSLATGVGFGEGQWELKGGNQNDTTWGVNGHLDVSFSGFTIGGSGVFRSNYINTSNTAVSAAAGSNYWTAGVGATYNWDAWTVGLAWSHGNYEVSSSSQNDTLDVVEFTGRYDLGPGISLDGMLGYSVLDTANNSGRQGDHTWEAGMGFFIGF